MKKRPLVTLILILLNFYILLAPETSFVARLISLILILAQIGLYLMRKS